jgi:hypothetical protein
MIEFVVLGPLQMSRDGQPVTPSAPMLRRLLAVLRCGSGPPVPVPALIEANATTNSVTPGPGSCRWPNGGSSNRSTAPLMPHRRPIREYETRPAP